MIVTLTYSERSKRNDGCFSESKCSDFHVTLYKYADKAMSEIVGDFSGELYENIQSDDDNCRTPDKHMVKGEFRLIVVN